jgi:hypothetical protein
VVLLVILKQLTFDRLNFTSMSFFTRFTSSLVGLFRGDHAKQKFLFLQQSKKQEQKLRNFCQQNGLSRLDDVEIQSWHNHP